MAIDPNEAPMTVAANIRYHRVKRGWSQTEAARIFHEHGGPLWSKAMWSWTERSADGKKVRQFTAHEIAVMAEIFEVPIGDMFTPPKLMTCPRCGGTGKIGASEVRLSEREQLAEDDES